MTLKLIKLTEDLRDEAVELEKIEKHFYKGESSEVRQYMANRIKTIKDAALKIEVLAHTLEDLDYKIHSGYDFNSDPESMTLKVFNTLN